MKTNKNLISIISVFMAVLMVLVNISLPVGALNGTIDADATVQKPVNPLDKIDSTLKEKMAEASPDEKIPVAIWFKDIDKEKLEAEVEQTCGVSREDVFAKQDYSVPEAQLSHAIESKNESALKSYVDDRIEESEELRRTKKLYKNTLISLASDYYTEHNESIVSTAGICEGDITFLSKLTPFMLAEFNSSELARLSADENILTIGYYEEEVETLSAENTRDANTDAMNIDKSFERFGLAGDGVTVLQIEADYVRSDEAEFDTIPYPENISLVINKGLYSPTDIDAIPYYSDNPTSHANHVVRALQEVAGDASVYSVHFFNYDDIEWAIENCNIDVINVSYSYNTVEYGESFIAQWYDALVSTYGIPFVASSGNSYSHFETNWPIAISPSCGYNGIAVGAYDTSEGRMWDFRYNPVDNPNVVRYKPDLTAAAPDTSTAAPYISGIVALMTQMDPNIVSNPALVKAILMASCHGKALPCSEDEPVETMFDGLTQKQGAGKVDAYKALSIVLMGTYDTDRVSYGSPNTIELSFPNDTDVNFSLAWLKGGSFPFELGPGTANSPNTVTAPLQELTLDVAYNGNVLDTSNATNSGKQLVYFSADQGAQYDVHISKATNNASFSLYACAWSASAQKEVSSVQLNGKMAKGQQLSAMVQCSDGTLAGANEVDYQWQSCAEGADWADITGATSGTYTLTAQDFLKKIRCVITPKTNSGILPVESVAESALSVIIFGDSNLSGGVNTRDATLVQKYVAGMVEFTPEQLFASDVNGDGNVNVNDAALIQSYVAAEITVFPVE